MPRRLQPEQQLELDALYRVVAVIAEWFDELSPESVRGQMTTAMRRAYDDRSLRGMRLAYNDLVEMTSAADAGQRSELDARLRVRANTNLGALRTKKLQRIERILTRAKITSEEQYYLVREHVELNVDSPTTAQQQLQLMLRDFEERYAARANRSAQPPETESTP